jgi:hypothetical protein
VPDSQIFNGEPIEKLQDNKGLKFIVPQVVKSREYLEITRDFHKEHEIIREAIHNAYDWGASNIKITISLQDDNLIIEFLDDGVGMTEERLKSFWNLGDSPGPHIEGRIGNKGHGTKIYLNSQQIIVRTYHKTGGYESICDMPNLTLINAVSALKNGEEDFIHKPTVREVEGDAGATGTYIKIVGYNNNKYKGFTQENIKDYIYWYTKLGSFEFEFENKDEETTDINKKSNVQGESVGNGEKPETMDEVHISIKGKDFKVYLKSFDYNGEHEELKFGHKFPPINDNLKELIEKYGTEHAADYFVNKYTYSIDLKENPGIHCDLIVFIEGNEAKKLYNPMLTGKTDDENDSQATYRVGDRYGLKLAKDFIPVEDANDWIPNSFGNGSNSKLRVHGFINCQNFRLTANRDHVSISTDVKNELKRIVKGKFREMNSELKKLGYWTLGTSKHPDAIKKKIECTEDNDYNARTEKISKRNRIIIKNQAVGKKDSTVGKDISPRKSEDLVVLEPVNESEMYGILIILWMLYPEKFEFNPLDYNTNRGVDMIVLDRNPVSVAEREFKYLELKYQISTSAKFNHTFRNLKWIVCWSFDQGIEVGSKLVSSANEERELVKEGDAWFLRGKVKEPVIQIIKLKDIIIEKSECFEIKAFETEDKRETVNKQRYEK